MKRVSMAAALLGLSASTGLGLAAVAAPAGAQSLCVLVNTSKGVLTAAYVDPATTPTMVETGCDIGVYYDSGGTGANLNGVTIDGPVQYGVFVDGGKGPVTVDVTNDTIKNVGDNPFDGAQHGIGVYYDGYQTPGTASGTIDGNTISRYQKGGIAVSGSNASAAVTNNTVTGLGRVGFIAQNGIQFGYGATGTARGNTVADNYYTGCSNQQAAKTGCIPYVSTGLLLYDIAPRSVSTSMNHFRGNQRNLYVGPSAQVSH